MNCITCKQEKVISVNAKCSDMYFGDYAEKGGSSYVPSGLGIGGGDYIEFKMCLNCGQVQDKFPKEPPKAENDED